MLLLFFVCLFAASADEFADFHPDRIIVKYRDSRAGNLLRSNLSTFECRVRRDFGPAHLAILESTNRPASLTVADAGKKQLRKTIESLRRSGLVQYAEPDYVIHTRLTPNDAAFVSGTLWGLRNLSANGGLLGADIGAVNAWNLTTGSSNVIVAIIDTGIRYTHQDLAAQMWRNPGELAGNGVDDDHDGYVDDVFGINAISGSGDPNDDQGHGTHVAGTIGAAANDGNPHVGVAWHVRLMACKFLDSSGSGYTSDAITCIDYAVAHGARIINASWGGDSYSQALYDAMDTPAAHNVLFVTAAGNDGSDNDVVPSYPASYALDNVISVAALDRADKLASFSNFGLHSVHLGAPGVQIFSCLNSSDSAYAYLDGTSMAAPHVSGVAALVLSRFTNATCLELRQRLLTTTRPVEALAGISVTGGMVNAFNALNAVADGQLEVSVTPVPGSTVAAGANLALKVRVTDLAAITNALVTAIAVNGTNYLLNDSGTAPDALAGDANYSGSIPVAATATNLELTLVIQAPGKSTSVVPVAFTVVSPPPNDNFTNRIFLGTGNFVTNGSSQYSGHENGEPSPTTLNAGGASVWFSWRAAQSGYLTITTDGSDFDTLLGVFTGTNLASLTRVASDDDSGSNLCSSLTFAVTQNVSYAIMVDGFSGVTGNLRLTGNFLTPPPPPTNDNFSNAIVLLGGSNLVFTSNLSATKETGEPNHAGNRGGRSLWWTWTATSNGLVTASTAGSGLDTTLAVYTGTNVTRLSVVASNDDDGDNLTSLVRFNAIQGTPYRIAVDGYSGAIGPVIFSLIQSNGIPAPANDDFENAIAATGTNFQLFGGNQGASRQSNEPNHTGNTGGASVWWRWTAPQDAFVTISTGGSDFDTLLAVYSGTSVSNLTTVAANDHDPSGATGSRVGFFAQAGQTYSVAVDGNNQGYGAARGNVVLNLSVAPPPSAVTNDYFAQSTWLYGWTNSVTANNWFATSEIGEPLHVNRPGGRSLWWSWTAPDDGSLRVSTGGSGFDTLLAVYRGNSVDALVPVAADDDSGGGRTSEASFAVTGGVTYRIAVDGFQGAAGAISLTMTGGPNPPPPVNDDFAAASQINNLTQPFTANTTATTIEPGEPLPLGEGADHTAWWRWTAPSNYVVTLTVSSTNFSPAINVYSGLTLSNLAATSSLSSGLRLPGQTSFLAGAGQTYYFQVTGYQGGSGGFAFAAALNPVVLPVVTRHPLPELTDVGKFVSFSSMATSASPLAIQWWKSGVRLTNDAVKVFGANEATLVILNVQPGDIGDYSATFQNAAGTVASATAPLKMNTPFLLNPSWTGAPLYCLVIQVGGSVNSTFSLESSTNLQDWVKLGRFTNLTGSLSVPVGAASGQPQLFFRAVSPGQP